MVNFSKIRRLLIGYDDSIDFNDYAAVKKAIKKIEVGGSFFGLAIYVIGVFLGLKFGMGIAVLTAVPFLLLLPSYLISYTRLVRSNAMSCNNCGRSLVTPWVPSTIYYQCKYCGTKP